MKVFLVKAYRLVSNPKKYAKLFISLINWHSRQIKIFIENHKDKDNICTCVECGNIMVLKENKQDDKKELFCLKHPVCTYKNSKF